MFRVIVFLLSALILFPRSVTPARLQEGYGAATTVTRIKNQSITESSGLIASRAAPGAYWTHNDSGDGPFIYAFDTQGESLGVFRVTGAEARDWEDISVGPGPQPNKSYLYVGDIGDNNEARSEIIVYRFLEPDLKPSDKTSTKARPRTTERAQAIRLKYPDGKHDAETLLVHPATGNLYIMTKVAFRNPVVYEASAPWNTGDVITLKRVGEVRVPSILGGAITGGAISPDGRRVAFCDYFQGYELVLPEKSTNFNDIWKEKMTGFNLGKRSQGEAITYRLDGNALLATSEGEEFDLLQVERRRSRM
jgi:hypothetical protein